MSESSTPWHYAINQFLNKTKRNYKRMLDLDEDHYSRLVGAALTDPEIDALKVGYEPIHLAYQQLYSNWRGAEGSLESRTLNVENLFTQLNQNLNVWEGQMFFVYPKGSVEEKNIFPDRRNPFQKGTYNQRISAIKTLYEKLATYTGDPTLMTLSTTVQSFYNMIEGARVQQGGGKEANTIYSGLVESQRVLCAKGMYGNLGVLMHKFVDNPRNIEGYWDMELLRKLDEEDFEWTMNVVEGPNVVPLPPDILEEMDADT